MHICKFCGKECKSFKSVKAHQPVCKQNPVGKSPSQWATGNRKGIPSWNAGLVGDERCKHTEESKKKMSDVYNRTEEWHKENGKRVSATVRRKVEEGTWHTSLAKRMHYIYKGIDLHGKWELAYAKLLDENNIKWIRNKDSFPYIFEGKERRYTPDFYLNQSDTYVEVKGYKTEKDIAKWDQFPKHRTLKVLMKEDLIKLGIKLD